MPIRRYLQWSTLALMLSLAAHGCKELNDDPPADASPTVEGTYVGVGRFNGSPQNVLVTLAEPDSAGRVQGSLRYGGQAWPLVGARVSEDEDTLYFSYVPGDVAVYAWAAVEATGLVIQHTEPQLPEFRVNREQGGVNMTGIWQGEMYSQGLDVWRDALMQMDQRGQLYLGTAEVSFLQTVQFQINTGVSSGTSFQLGGTARIGVTDYPAALTGQYLAADTVQGNWQIGQSGEVDGGAFVFIRSF